MVLGASCFTGCFIEYDRERDFKRAVAKLESYTIVDPNATVEQIENNTAKTYQTEEFTLYKYQLANLVSSYYDYINAGYYTVDSLMQSVLTQQLFINAAYAYKDFGYIRWTQVEENEVTDYKYSVIDDYLEEQIQAIYDERGELYIPAPAPEEEEEGESTYPVYSDESRLGYDAMSRQQLINECLDKELIGSADEGSALSRYGLIKLLKDYAKSNAGYNMLTNEELRAELIELDTAYTATQINEMSRNELMRALDDYYYALNASREYEVSRNRIPGINGDDERRSLECEAMNRVLLNLEETTDAAENLTEEERQALDQSWAEIKKVKTEQGITHTYQALGESYVMDYLVGESYTEQILVNLLEEYVQSTVNVTDEEVENRYTTLLSSQRAAYGASVDNFISAAEDGETLIVFEPKNEYFFVKHVLVPFSDAQKTALSNYETSVDNQKYGDKTEYRAKLASEITGYAHIDGEDYGDALSVNDIYAEIVKTITEATVAEKDLLFTRLIYKYSTDTAGFTYKYGYKEKAELADGESESYMQEFADAARELNATGKVGALSGQVVTDYGVHIMMLTKLANTAERIVGLDEYAAASDTLTVREQIEDELYSSKLSDVYVNWQQESIRSNYNAHVKTYESVYENIIEDMTKEN